MHFLTLKVSHWNSLSTRRKSNAVLAVHINCHYSDETLNHKQLPEQDVLTERGTFLQVFSFKEILKSKEVILRITFLVSFHAFYLFCLYIRIFF